MSILSLTGIHRSFEPGIPVLDGINLEIGSGEVVGLIGRNGSGKTTLINIALGMLQQQQGSARFRSLAHALPLPTVFLWFFCMFWWVGAYLLLGRVFNRIEFPREKTMNRFAEEY